MSMQVIKARIRGGAIVPDEGVQLPEGSRVTVIAGEAGGPFALTAAEETRLAESVADADPGDVVATAELLRRPRR